MNRHSCQSHTGTATVIPPYVATFSRVTNASSGPVKTNASFSVEGLPSQRRVTTTAPAACAGAIAVISVACRLTSVVAGASPNHKLHLPRGRFSPPAVTIVPPSTEPVAGAMRVKCGGAAT